MSVSPIAMLSGTPEVPPTAEDARPLVAERSRKNPDGSVEIPLLYPIPVEARTASSITLRRPKLKELKLIEAKDLSGFGTLEFLLGQLAALAPSSTDQIDAEDTGEISEVIRSFLPKDRRIGEDKPSK